MLHHLRSIPLPPRTTPRHWLHIYLTAHFCHHFSIVDPLPIPSEYQQWIEEYIDELWSS